MYIILALAAVVNILAMIVLLAGLFYNFEQPKNKAVYGYTVAGSMLVYILVLSAVAGCELILKHYLYSLVLLLCVLSPFVIGKIVKYNTLKKYTVAQILCYVVSLSVILVNF